MNIHDAKNQVKNAVRAYMAKDDCPTLPLNRSKGQKKFIKMAKNR